MGNDVQNILITFTRTKFNTNENDSKKTMIPARKKLSYNSVLLPDATFSLGVR